MIICTGAFRVRGKSGWDSWGRSLQKWLKCKNEHHYGVLATFSSLGGSGWRLLGLSWGILARSWAILGDLGVKLGPCWQHVGTKMAKMSQDRRTWEQNGWLKAMRYARPGWPGVHLSARRRVPRSLYKQELAKIWHWKFNTPVPGAGGYIQCAASAKPPPCRTCSWKLKKAA